MNDRNTDHWRWVTAFLCLGGSFMFIVMNILEEPVGAFFFVGKVSLAAAAGFLIVGALLLSPLSRRGTTSGDRQSESQPAKPDSAASGRPQSQPQTLLVWLRFCPLSSTQLLSWSVGAATVFAGIFWYYLVKVWHQ